MIMCRSTMHLYIRSSSFSTEVPGIHLLNGHIPAIGNLTPEPEGKEDVFPTIEPAVWFKVLVIDSVSIDCTKRAIHWNSSVINVSDSDLNELSTEESLVREKRKRISESMFIGGECYGYHNDLDELFDSAQDLLDSYVSSQLSCKEFHRQILILLHCYVLPNIKLTTDDIQELDQALKKQETLIRECDTEILQKYVKLDGIENSMSKLRLRFVDEVNNATSDVSYPPDLVKYLQKHIESDIRLAWVDIETKTDGIQKLKLDLSDQESGQSYSSSSSNEETASDEILTHKRNERSVLLKKYHSLISAREALYALANGGSVILNPPPKKWTRKVKKVTKRKKKSPAQPNPLHDIYLELNRKWVEVERDIQHSALKKVRLISVKEALRSALHELQDNDETYGIDLDPTGSLRPTDILRQSKVPKQWQTLTEKVCRYLNKGGSVTKKYEEFKSTLLTRCSGLIEEYSKFEQSEVIGDEEKELNSLNPVFHNTECLSRSAPNSSCFSDAIRSIPKSKFYREAHQSMLSLTAANVISTSRDSTDFLFVFDKERDYLIKGIEKLKEDIKEHFTQMVQKLLDKIGLENTQTNISKVWLCYESYFYEALMPTLCNVYQKAYAKNMLSLQEVLPTLTVRELNLTDSLLMQLLETQDCHVREDEDETLPKSDSSISESFASEEVNSSDSGRDAMDVSRQNIVSENICDTNDSSETSCRACICDVDPANNVDISCEKDITSPYSSRHALYVMDKQEKADEALAQLSEVTLNLTDNPQSIEMISQHCGKDDKSKDIKSINKQDASASGGDDCRFESVHLEMLPSISNLSDDSSVESHESVDESSSSNAFGSIDNLRLLQEAEDIVAGLKPLNGNQESETKELSEASSNSVVLRYKSKGIDRSQSSKEESLSSNQELPVVMKQIQVHHPTSVTLVYHRCTWPIPHADQTYKHVDESVECGDDALHLTGDNPPKRKHKKSHAHSRHTSVYFKHNYRDRFNGAIECLNNMLTETAPLAKLRSLTMCLRKLDQQLTKIQQELDNSVSAGASTDNLIDMLVILLCNYDPVLACRLYPQIVLLGDVIAPFFEGGPYNFSLVQFFVAFKFLQDQLVLKQNISENAQARQAYENEFETSA